MVLLADGSTKAIDQSRVCDTIANPVLSVAGTQAHKVTAVIVTHTDHDFVDLTIKATAGSAAKQGVKAGAKSLAKKVARKAAFGLAASAAVLGALAASHGHGTAQEPATRTVAAVSSATSGKSATAAAGTTSESDARGAHLTTTFHHPFYDETQSAFVDAKDLKAGDVLQTPTGTAEVTGVRLYHANTTTYDLTIGSLHTYYVEAGGTRVLVHNTNSNPQAMTCETHTVDVDVHDVAGNVRLSYSLRSGNWEDEELAIGDGRSRIASHTENRAARMSGGPSVIGKTPIPGDPYAGLAQVSEGESVILTGTRPPSTTCQGAMNRAAKATGANFVYLWTTESGELRIWQALNPLKKMR
ncbi:polymorphic toxin-type HINT domain-containing protein [Streptomyces cylindrosporus]|uniref:Intein C-terminal splicing domain-containing protein n=1 Tax=Streptomyces cylindrosporus TaxID=2927583 RepID=A0ABS9Y5Q9_9ACTN|nr:polymorphic toxin-type HINT domain-containing protein [Streptomyces cylindrosporus]MCI3272556.1 hypothetical protein [Streptomyces cylindrosporus]